MSNKTAQDLFGLVGHRLDEYEVERVVAAGGFGIVYFARHRVLRQPVAIKVMKVPPSLSEQDRATFMQLFLEEAQTIAALKHPAIVGVLGFKVSPMPIGTEAPWMALEWIEGETLGQQLAERRGQGGRAPRECLRLLEPVFDALAFAHAQGVAHRDIKPANLMIPGGSASTSGRFGAMTRVLDFGIAKVMKSNEAAGSGYTETASQFQAFSMPYASIEQLSGTRTGPWTDVHALALILTELLTDRPPYRPGDRSEMMMQIMSPTRPTPAQHGVDVGAWEPVLSRALSLKPAERYANAGEFLAALEQNMPTNVQRSTARQTFPNTEPMGQAPQVPQVTVSTTVPVTARSRSDAAPQGQPSSRRAAIAAALVGLLVVGGLGTFVASRLTGVSPTGAPAHAAAPTPFPSPAVAPPTQRETNPRPPSAPPPPVAARHEAVAAPTTTTAADAGAGVPQETRRGRHSSRSHGRHSRGGPIVPLQ